MRQTRYAFVQEVALRAGAVLTAVALFAGCSEQDKTGATTGGGVSVSSATAAVECDAASVVECAPEGTTVDDLLPDSPAAADGEPIRIGMINTDTGPANTFPELTQATRAGIQWINEELGGVDGRPIELFPCDTRFTGTGSMSCAQQMVDKQVVAVLGGIDVFDDGVKVLEDNGIPLVGGIPVGFNTVNSPMSFQFSGGAWSGDLALAYHITEVLEAKSAAVVYSDYGPVADGAAWTKRALLRGGIAESDINMVPMPVIAEDMLSPMTAANETDPEAMIVLIAGSGCTAAFQAAQDIGVEAQQYYSGGCIAATTAFGVDKVEGYIFTIENEVEGEQPDSDLYGDVIERYGEGMEAAGAGTVAFKSLMNLYDQLREIGGENVSSESLVDSLRGAVDHRSFMGAPYTCDGKQMAGKLPAVCSPQEILTTLVDGVLTQLGGWIDITEYVGDDA